MATELFKESVRIKTFDTWNCRYVDKFALAAMGMYYTGPRDRVQCYFCNLTLQKWCFSDSPIRKHIMYSPNCPFVKGEATNNVPETDNEEILKEIFNEINIRTLPVERRCEKLDPLHEKYKEESKRLQSYRNWPKHLKQNPTILAQAGFFYSGIADNVICYCCGGVLKDWKDKDDAWEQHALWYRKCPFLKIAKGQNFIYQALQKFNQPRVNCDLVELESSSPPPPKKKKVKKPAKTEQETMEDKLCKICYENEYSTAFSPCGHVIACAKCASVVTKCPFCRETFSYILPLFFC